MNFNKPPELDRPQSLEGNKMNLKISEVTVVGEEFHSVLLTLTNEPFKRIRGSGASSFTEEKICGIENLGKTIREQVDIYTKREKSTRVDIARASKKGEGDKELNLKDDNVCSEIEEMVKNGWAVLIEGHIHPYPSTLG